MVKSHTMPPHLFFILFYNGIFEGPLKCGRGDLIGGGGEQHYLDSVFMRGKD